MCVIPWLSKFCRCIAAPIEPNLSAQKRQLIRQTYRWSNLDERRLAGYLFEDASKPSPAQPWSLSSQNRPMFSTLSLSDRFPLIFLVPFLLIRHLKIGEIVCFFLSKNKKKTPNLVSYYLWCHPHLEQTLQSLFAEFSANFAASSNSSSSLWSKLASAGRRHFLCLSSIHYLNLLLLRGPEAFKRPNSQTVNSPPFTPLSDKKLKISL